MNQAIEDIFEYETKKNLTITSDDKEESLDSVLYKFIALYERYAEDRKKVADQRAEISDFLKKFTAQVDHFESLKEEITNQIDSSLERANLMVATQIRKAASDTIREETRAAARDISKAVHDAQETLSNYQSSLTLRHWQIVLVMFLSSIVTALLIFWFLMPKAMVPLTDEQLKIYEIGKNFSELWPTLSKEKQKWFLKNTS